MVLASSSACCCLENSAFADASNDICNLAGDRSDHMHLSLAAPLASSSQWRLL